ncbi:hypothetical protein BGLA2_580049 [Burkholderia gladioli]|nr:hypothetical protein BGLA2_580049 [Burkholderia gladioli]
MTTIVWWGLGNNEDAVAMPAFKFRRDGSLAVVSGRRRAGGTVLVTDEQWLDRKGDFTAMPNNLPPQSMSGCAGTSELPARRRRSVRACRAGVSRSGRP